MPKLNYVKKARKDNPVAKIGESYYWWQFAFSPIQYSKDKPKRWQLTKSEFLQTVYQMEDGLGPTMSVGDLESLITDIEELRDEQQDKLSNMPDTLQDSSILNERIETLDDFITELESILSDVEGADLAGADLSDSDQPVEEQIADRVKEVWPGF